MQRTKFSKILQNDFPGIQDRLPGNHILQSHGKSVSRGDLITQENITVSDKWTVTINKDTYAYLCQQATSWAQVGGPYPDLSSFVIGGAIATDDDGIYASTYGSGSGWHGPMFYTTLPSEIGKAGQYWHIVFTVKATFASGTKIWAGTIVGFSSILKYVDESIPDSYGAYLELTFNASKNSSFERVTKYLSVGSTNTYTLKLYHYQNNTYKLYINDTLSKSGSDPLVLDKGNNIAACPLMQNSTYATPYIRVQEITVSTDPTFDPQP